VCARVRIFLFILLICTLMHQVNKVFKFYEFYVELYSVNIHLHYY